MEETYPGGRQRERAAPMMTFDIVKELDALREQRSWDTRGFAALTLVKYPDFRIVLIAMRAGGHMNEHHVAERISVHTLSGHVEVHLASGTVDLPAGTLLALEEGIEHDVRAVEESAVLLSISWPNWRESRSRT
jgi:quercetin dioxygenase-like cupin family protein